MLVNRRGQGAVEYIFLVCLILAFVLTIMMAGFRETELNLAVASSRLAINDFVAAKGFDCTLAGVSLDAVLTNSRARVINPDLRCALTPPADADLQPVVLTAVAKSLTPGFQGDFTDACLRGASHDFSYVTNACG